MFLSENLLLSHFRKPRRKTSQYLSSFIAIACAGLLSGSSAKDGLYSPISSTEEYKKTPFSLSVEARELVEHIITIKEAERISLEKQQERNMHSLSKVPMNDRGVFWMCVFHDLYLDTETMMNLIQRESSGFSDRTSSKWAKWLMQVKDIVLDDMQGIDWVKKYWSLFLSLQNDTIGKITYDEDKRKIILLKKFVRSILLSLRSKNKEKLWSSIAAYDNLISALKVELYNPDINIIFGSVYMRYLQQFSDSAQKYEQAETIVKNLNDDDIYRINQLRHANKKDLFPPEYDFSILDVSKIIPLALYNVWPYAKNMRPGVLYAIAILG